mmetsp:Transcript_10724/g.30164  ORF Transcript_10724/g.30164 Transcript_10724/m.30164 type:complete len:382 (-) Transcript_10724:1226-2371(-)|eukprot:CAMPEP_0181065736 /NCGR_PEP_ID=MMETSP1070-20121207/24899_1 /TAXON_ID=265543 /ORGANISM="Minutocellus polymorphus, Strain NH13" /LENGTH=381 /DNA_ID=CAMNT_0023146149 /DNA_START=30 /DNA_END=1175 /DNA_ORIENTATION=+
MMRKIRVPFLFVLTSTLSCAQAFAPGNRRPSSLPASPSRSFQLSAFSGGGGGSGNNGINRNRVSSDFGKTQQQQQQPQQQIGTSSGQYGGGYDNYNNDGDMNFGGEYGVEEDGYGPSTSQQFRSDQFLQHISDFCIGCNDFWRGLCIPPLRDFLETKPGGTALSNPLSKIIAGPEYPGISRPLWLVMAGSFATWFNWFGYYIFVVNEELYQYELQTTGRVTTCGGYGTFVAYVFGVFIGAPLVWADIPGGEFVLESAVVWLALSQMNLYRRVNELTQESRDVMGLQGDGRMLHEWWALLPPPMNLVVGLRQIYFLSEYWRVIRGDPPATDYIAQDWLPFVAERRRFSLEELWTGQVPWFWFMKSDFNFENPFNRNQNNNRF